MTISLERHATSKIRKIEDLQNTYTMGFRGEALASIASISEMTMVSKTKEEITGHMLKATAGNILVDEEIGAQTGTTIIVEKLFFNTPVRYKFLKQDFVETRYIKEWLQKEALANPNISFRLLNDGKKHILLAWKWKNRRTYLFDIWKRNKRKYSKCRLYRGEYKNNRCYREYIDSKGYKKRSNNIFE